VVYRREPCGRLERLWVEAEQHLNDFDRTCHEAGIPWVLHVIPAEIQVDERVRAVVLDRLGLSEENYDFDLPQHRLRQFAEQHGIACWCPLEELRRISHPESSLYIPQDTHWGKRGNEVAGILLADFIKDAILAGSGTAR
jgi:hypothetical protein